MKRFFILFLALLFSITVQGQSSKLNSGTLIVLNKSEHTASLIDTASKKVVSTVATGTGPHEVAVSSNGKTAVVANYGGQGKPGNSLTVIDVPNKKAIKTIELGEYMMPHGIVWLKGNLVCVTAERNKALLIVDVKAGKVIQAIETGQNISHMVALTPNGKYAFIANIGSGSATVIDLKTNKHVTDITTGAGAEGIDVSPDGKEVWVTNRAANTVSVIDTASLKVVVTIESKDFPIRSKFSPDGKYVLVSNARSGDVAVFDAKTRKELKRIKMQLSAVNEADKRLFGNQFGDSPVPVGILIAPDGRHAFIANTNADIVTVIDLKTWQVTDRLTAGKEPDGLGFSKVRIN